MWATLVLASVLPVAPAQAGTLQLKNDRVTFGVLGQERKDTKLLPGDLFVVSFDIDGLKTSETGKMRYSMAIDLTNKEGKSQFKSDPRELEAVNALGGNRVPAFALVEIGTDTAPGEYTLKVTIKDVSANKSETLTRAFEIVPPRLGFARIGLAYENQTAAPAVCVPGQRLYINFAIAGFELEKARKDQPNVEVEMRILDENGKPTLAKPFSGTTKEVAPQFKKIIPMQFYIDANRPGKFKIELKVTDKVNGKSVEQTLDFNVVEPK